MEELRSHSRHEWYKLSSFPLHFFSSLHTFKRTAPPEQVLAFGPSVMHKNYLQTWFHYRSMASPGLVKICPWQGKSKEDMPVHMQLWYFMLFVSPVWADILHRLTESHHGTLRTTLNESRVVLSLLVLHCSKWEILLCIHVFSRRVCMSCADG